MEVVIYTSEPDQIDRLEVRRALEVEGYYVESVKIESRK